MQSVSMDCVSRTTAIAVLKGHQSNAAVINHNFFGGSLMTSVALSLASCSEISYKIPCYLQN